MTPVPFRGKQCDSSMIRLTAEKIAAVRGMEVSKLLRAAWENAERLFGISLLTVLCLWIAAAASAPHLCSAGIRGEGPAARSLRTRIRPAQIRTACKKVEELWLSRILMGKSFTSI